MLNSGLEEEKLTLVEIWDVEIIQDYLLSD